MFKGDIILSRIHGDPHHAGLCICLVTGEPSREWGGGVYQVTRVYRVTILDCESNQRKYIGSTWSQHIDDVLEILVEEAV